MSGFYAILDISNTASTKAIKSAYRKKAKLYHPDKNNGGKHAEEQFRLVQNAYQTLSNPLKRKQYDLMHSHKTYSTYQANQFNGSGYPFTGGMPQPRPEQNKKSSKEQPTEEVPEENDYRYLIISAVIALVLIYFVRTYRF